MEYMWFLYLLELLLVLFFVLKGLMKWRIGMDMFYENRFPVAKKQIVFGVVMLVVVLVWLVLWILPATGFVFVLLGLGALFYLYCLIFKTRDKPALTEAIVGIAYAPIIIFGMGLAAAKNSFDGVLWALGLMILFFVSFWLIDRFLNPDDGYSRRSRQNAEGGAR